MTNLQTTYRGTTGASSIGVTSGFVYSGSNNLQGVLQDLDRAIQHRQAGVEAVQTNITNETTARVAADTTLQTNLNTHSSTNISTAHPNGYLPISRLGSSETTFINIATQAELDGEASTRAAADSAEASARAAADSAEASARRAKDDEHDDKFDILFGGDIPHIKAWGTVTTSGAIPVLNGHYNVSSVVFTGGPSSPYRVSFISVMSNANYSVTATSTFAPPYDTGLWEPALIAISDKTTDGFTAELFCKDSGVCSRSGAFDFSVIQN